MATTAVEQVSTNLREHLSTIPPLVIKLRQGVTSGIISTQEAKGELACLAIGPLNLHVRILKKTLGQSIQ